METLPVIVPGALFSMKIDIPIDGYISDIEDAGYRELYTKILKKVNELRAGLPSTNNTSNTCE